MFNRVLHTDCQIMAMCTRPAGLEVCHTDLQDTVAEPEIRFIVMRCGVQYD